MNLTLIHRSATGHPHGACGNLLARQHGNCFACGNESGCSMIGSRFIEPTWREAMLFCGLLLLGPPATALDSTPAATVPRESAELTMLRQIEARVLPLLLVAGPPRNETLADYYTDANVPLRARFDEAVGAFNSGKPSRFQALTIVAGSAGVGKTFVKQNVYRDWIPEDQIWKVDIRQWFGELADQGLAELKPDVCHGDQVINRLLSLKPAGREEFIRRLRRHARAFVVIDSLDEIHPHDYFFVLAELERFALRGDRQFIHVVIFGRPLVFREYWRDRRSEGIPNGLQGFVLNPPDFRTTGDLLVSSWNYNCWKYGLSRVAIDGETRSMRLADFQQWCDRDFVTTGEFADVTFEQNKSMCPQVRDELRQWSMQHRVVAAALPNLAGNSIVREIVQQRVERGQAFDEAEFMDEFFQRWLERDTQSDDRPSRLKPQHLELYVKLLEAVAAKYVNEHRVNGQGYFDVIDDDVVVVEHQDATVSVPVRRLLNRSGLVNLDPVLPVASRYRFEPFWFHRHLLSKHYQRQANVTEPPDAASITADNF